MNGKIKAFLLLGTIFHLCGLVLSTCCNRI